MTEHSLSSLKLFGWSESRLPLKNPQVT